MSQPTNPGSTPDAQRNSRPAPPPGPRLSDELGEDLTGAAPTKPNATTPKAPAGGSTPPAPAPGGMSEVSPVVWTALIAVAVVVAGLLTFILQNNDDTTVNFLFWHWTLPLGVALLMASIGGVLLAGIVGATRFYVMKRRFKKQAAVSAGPKPTK